ncbi:unnamed protein product [Parnassius apollo]|uniref:(apollo) hypothetical protein n=1 Tax=Parnassius apollo TaxID=110799 RepID=A0A8S3YAR7_PARAO|nr:unnamed protein product [Parnassius apollo]
MIVHQRNKKIVYLKNVDRRIEPFTYPLFYPAGTDGYSPDLQLQTSYSSRSHLTRLELAQHRLSFRPEFVKFLTESTSTEGPDVRELSINALHFGGRLFQQYLVDTYIRVERGRIQWIKYNQNKILDEQYTGVTSFLNQLAEKKNATVEDKTISQQLPQDRPDIVARVAKLKFDQILEDLDKKQVFGKVSAFVYATEFQKRGLPHMHLLIIMKPGDKIHQAEELDDLMSSEIPQNDDLELRELVLKWMIHNPCGDLNTNAICMVHKNGRT